jgi:hypothetical protein
VSVTLPPALRRWQLTDEIPLAFPVLDRWLERHAQNLPLRGVTALLIQHQLGNHVPQAKALIDLGLDPRQLFWIDIPYTATPSVRAALIALGIPEPNLLTHRFHLLDKYGPSQRLRVQHFLQRLVKDPPDLLLVLDDGSYALEALACLRDPPLRIAIVEQTTRGLIKIEESAALAACARRYPIINVARSTPKTVLEPPFIGVAVCDALRRRLGAALHVVGSDHCLVLGYGAIGRQVAAFANEILGFPRARVHVFDTDPTRVTQAQSAGFIAWARTDRDIRFRLVIGCSGRASFAVGDHALLEDGAFLASATSGTVELSREEFIELAEASPHDDIEIDRRGLDEFAVHSDLKFRFVDREAVFVNGGFPVNFDGRVNCVPGHYIQPTPTMMCHAALQAVASSGKYLIDLDRDFSRWLDTEFRAELGDESSWLPAANC